MKQNPKPSNAQEGDAKYENGAKPKQHEKFTALAMVKAGYRVKFIPSSTIIGMADCYIENTIFEIKAPEGSTIQSIERNLRKAVDHQSANIIFDSFRMRGLSDNSIQNLLSDRLRRGHGVQRLFFVRRDRKVIDINSLIR